MSLEKAIEENTAVMRELIAIMSRAAGAIAPPAAPDGAAPPAAPDGAAPVDKPRREKRQTEGEVAALKLAGTANDPAKYDWEKDVKPKLMQLQAEVSKEALIAVLHRHGVKKVTELTQSMYPTVMQMAQESIDKKNASAEEADLSDDLDLV
jgi:hypothetical protein